MADYIVREYIVRETTYPVGGTKQEVIGELLRCRDCKYWDTIPRSTVAPLHHQCKETRLMTTGIWYCPLGKRKDGDHHDTV